MCVWGGNEAGGRGPQDSSSSSTSTPGQGFVARLGFKLKHCHLPFTQLTAPCLICKIGITAVTPKGCMRKTWVVRTFMKGTLLFEGVRNSRLPLLTPQSGFPPTYILGYKVPF